MDVHHPVLLYPSFGFSTVLCGVRNKPNPGSEELFNASQCDLVSVSYGLEPPGSVHLSRQERLADKAPLRKLLPPDIERNSLKTWLRFTRLAAARRLTNTPWRPRRERSLRRRSLYPHSQCQIRPWDSALPARFRSEGRHFWRPTESSASPQGVL